MNLDEWLAILAETGLFPTLDSLNLDALTGTGSALDVSGARPDAAGRSQTRSDGLDSDAARREAGKTHLACAILSRIIGDGYSGLFLTVSAGLRLIRSTYSPGADRTEMQVFEMLTRPDLLVLDEVGVAIGNDTTRRAMLFDVLNVRYGEMPPTILIGNLTAAEMENYLGERIMDRLLELGSATVPFTWPSHRRRACSA